MLVTVLFALVTSSHSLSPSSWLVPACRSLSTKTCCPLAQVLTKVLGWASGRQLLSTCTQLVLAACVCWPSMGPTVIAATLMVSGILLTSGNPSAALCISSLAPSIALCSSSLSPSQVLYNLSMPVLVSRLASSILSDMSPIIVIIRSSLLMTLATAASAVPSAASHSNMVATALIAFGSTLAGAQLVRRSRVWLSDTF